jgi:hypothetical protein
LLLPAAIALLGLGEETNRRCGCKLFGMIVNRFDRLFPCLGEQALTLLL